MTRQEALNILHNASVYHPDYLDALNMAIEALEQESIIHCKDCKHFVRDDVEEHTPYGFYNTYFYAFCDKHYDKEQDEYIEVKLDDYCSFAERMESDEE